MEATHSLLLQPDLFGRGHFLVIFVIFNNTPFSSWPIITYWMEHNKLFEVIEKPLTYRHWHYAVASGIITQKKFVAAPSKKTTKSEGGNELRRFRELRIIFSPFCPKADFPLEWWRKRVWKLLRFSKPNYFIQQTLSKFARGEILIQTQTRASLEEGWSFFIFHQSGVGQSCLPFGQ